MHVLIRYIKLITKYQNKSRVLFGQTQIFQTSNRLNFSKPKLELSELLFFYKNFEILTSTHSPERVQNLNIHSSAGNRPNQGWYPENLLLQTISNVTFSSKPPKIPDFRTGFDPTLIKRQLVLDNKRQGKWRKITFSIVFCII